MHCNKSSWYLNRPFEMLIVLKAVLKLVLLALLLAHLTTSLLDPSSVILCAPISTQHLNSRILSPLYFMILLHSH